MTDLLMPNVNSVIIAGRLTKDPAFRRTTNGTPVANFTISSNRRYKDNLGQNREEVCYVGVVAWYKLAESCAENLKRNSAVIIEGELQSRSWKLENGYYKNIVEIKAHRIQFLQRKDADTDIAETHQLNEDAIDDREEIEEEKSDTISDKEAEKAETTSDSKPEPEKPQYDFGYNDLQI